MISKKSLLSIWDILKGEGREGLKFEFLQFMKRMDITIVGSLSEERGDN
jgi:hypothetical protein